MRSALYIETESHKRTGSIIRRNIICVVRLGTVLKHRRLGHGGWIGVSEAASLGSSRVVACSLQLKALQNTTQDMSRPDLTARHEQSQIGSSRGSDGSQIVVHWLFAVKLMVQNIQSPITHHPLRGPSCSACLCPSQPFISDFRISVYCELCAAASAAAAALAVSTLFMSPCLPFYTPISLCLCHSQPNLHCDSPTTWPSSTPSLLSARRRSSCHL
jgi:hypothetical protein